jgi:hypothetical protein
MSTGFSMGQVAWNHYKDKRMFFVCILFAEGFMVNSKRLYDPFIKKKLSTSFT